MSTYSSKYNMSLMFMIIFSPVSINIRKCAHIPIRIFIGCILESQWCKNSSWGQQRLIRLCEFAGWFEVTLCADVRRHVFSRWSSNTWWLESTKKIEKTSLEKWPLVFLLVKTSFQKELDVQEINTSLRKHAYLNILKILPPKNENFR